MRGFSNLLARVMVLETVVAAFVIGAGLIWFLAANPGASPGDHVFSGEPKYFTDPVEMVRRAMDVSEVGHRRGLIMIGVVILLLGPVVRVAVAGLGYVFEHDRLYAVVSGIVLAVLVYSFFW